MKSRYLSTISLFLLVAACASSSPRRSSGEEFAEGSIEYPFAEETVRIGKNQNKEPFSIKTGQGQYQVDLPGAADDYDVNLPLQAMPQASPAPAETAKTKPNMTDREFEANMPKLAEPDDRYLMESALGLGENGGPGQAPSYTLMIDKINDLFRLRKYELALVEINQLLGFYPTDPRLYKMKGTILVKTRNFKMAELAWTRAAEFAPLDASLKSALAKLRERNLSEARSH